MSEACDRLFGPIASRPGFATPKQGAQAPPANPAQADAPALLGLLRVEHGWLTAEASPPWRALLGPMPLSERLRKRTRWGLAGRAPQPLG